MRVFKALAEELVRLGVTDLFSVPASGTMKITVCATERGVAHFSTRHEQAAVGMADGYARVSGKVGVVLVARGPGLTNGVNALITARKAGSAVLIVAGELSTALAIDPEAARSDIANMQTIDQERFLSSIGVTPVTITSAQSAVADFRHAYALAQTGVPVAVLLRGDVTEREAGDAPSPREAPAARTPTPPSPDEIAVVADLLGETWAARRPLILAGRGAVAAGAIPDLVRLGASIGAVLGTTLAAKGAFAGNDYDIGVVGTESTPIGAELIVASDIVLAFGASLNHFTTYGNDLLKQASVVHVDTEPRAFGRYHAADVSLVVDARLAAAALADEVEKRGHAETGHRAPGVQDRISSERVDDWVRDEGRPGALDPRQVLIAVERALPQERAVVIDVGAHMSFSSRFLSASEPEAFLLTHDYGSVGAGMGIALGAAVARPDRLTVLAIGDGGLMMTLADLDTAVRYSLPLLAVVLNDGGFGQEVQLLDMDNMPRDIALYANPPLAGVAAALGGDGLKVEDLSDLDGLTERIANLTGPFVLDCAISADVRGEHTDLLVRMARARASAV